MERSELMEKIRKLLALAASPNENEAALAAAKAQEMMAKYGIHVLESEIKAKRVDEHMSGITKDTTAWLVQLFQGIAKVNDLQTYWWTSSRKLVAMGLPADIEITEYLFKYLRRAIQELAMGKDSELKALGKLVEARRSYCLGATKRIVDRLTSMKREREQAEVACRSLVIRKDRLVEDYLVEKGYQHTRSRMPKADEVNFQSYWRGFEDGKDVPIHHAVR